MNPDLEHLIRLQHLDSQIDEARRRISEIPQVQDELAARLAGHQGSLADAKARLADTQTARREIEKEVAAVQTRLSKYKDQLMAVKTNKEYQAMQKEIATAEEAIHSHEDRILERMEEAETWGRDFKTAEADLENEEREIARERQQLDAERQQLESSLAGLADDRARVAKDLSAPALHLFEHVSRQRRGLAVAEARDGHCMVCHVRLRPQVFNEIRRCETLIQCESCLRILYFVPTPAPDSAAPPS